jgi:hypothetical protein
MKNESSTILAIPQAAETAADWRGRLACTLTAIVLLGFAMLSRQPGNAIRTNYRHRKGNRPG